MDSSIQNDITASLLDPKGDDDEYNMLKKKYDKVSDGVGWRLVFYFNVFMACVSFSIILPSLWPYLEMFDADENFLAFVLFIYSFGEFIGAIAWGYIYNASSMKFSLYSCILTGLIGSLLYSIGGYFPGYGKWLVALGRLLQGLWTGGQQTIEQAYISECIDKKENLGLIANIGAAAVIGFTVGPIVGLGVTRRNYPPYPPGGGYFSRIHNSCKLSPSPLQKIR